MSRKDTEHPSQKRAFGEWRKTLADKLHSQGASEYTLLIALSALMGVVAGLVAVVFHSGIDWMTHVFFGEHMPSHSLPELVIFIPVVGMFLQWMMRRIAPDEAKKRGVYEVIEAVSLRDGYISPKTTLFHFLTPIICMGSGGTVGPEAPAAQTGAGAVSAVCRLLGLSKAQMRLFTAAGSGAAIAGVFNTPMAGVFFCIEVVLLNEMHPSALSAFLLTSVAAGSVSRAFLGDAPKFTFGELHLGPPHYLIFFLLLGLGSGVIAILFIKANDYSAQTVERLPLRLPIMLTVGLLMGLSGYVFPQLFGIGYAAVNDLLAGKLSLSTSALLLVLKFLLVTMILSSGGFGGVFAPSLFMGAAFGYLFAGICNQVLGLTLHPTTFTLVGMGSMLAGVNSVPLTSILLLFEMTNDYRFILPLMAGVVGSHAVTHFILGGSIYQFKLRRKGLDKSRDREHSILRDTPVRNLLREKPPCVEETTAVAELVRYFVEKDVERLYVIRPDGQISGVITLATMRYILAESENLQIIIAKDVAEPRPPLIDAEDTLEAAMPVFAKGYEEIPVIESRNPAKFVGVLHHKDVMALLHRAPGSRSLAAKLMEDMVRLREEKMLEITPGLFLYRAPVPDEFIGKTIAELALRNTLRIELMMIERRRFDDLAPQQILPEKDTVFHRGDEMILYGTRENIEIFRQKFGG
ncbi:MAG: chloride channel protein [candidate division KSB1 bacterium]|nr:chloride channel protein [candidate division KSB1 bacterium]